MRVTRFQDPGAFRATAEPYLLEDEPRHNLILGILGTVISQPDVYPEHQLWLVTKPSEEDRPVLAALRTPPFNVLIAKPLATGAVEALVAELVREDIEVPGVIGALPEADDFATAYCGATGARVATRQDQAIHVLERVEPVPVPPGRLAHRLAEEAGEGIRLWEDGEVVSLVGFAGATANTARIAPVYTPPGFRRRGYATALTAHVSRELLERGQRFCMLYTDLANPTSNAIYARVGYRRICDSAMISLEGTGKPRTARRSIAAETAVNRRRNGGQPPPMWR